MPPFNGNIMNNFILHVSLGGGGLWKNSLFPGFIQWRCGGGK